MNRLIPLALMSAFFLIVSIGCTHSSNRKKTDSRDVARAAITSMANAFQSGDSELLLRLAGTEVHNFRAFRNGWSKELGDDYYRILISANHFESGDGYETFRLDDVVSPTNNTNDMLHVYFRKNENGEVVVLGIWF